MGDRLLTVDDLGEQLGLAKQTIYRKRSDGDDLPEPIKIGNRLRWRQSTVDAWLAKQEMDTKAAA
ncbi:helix-turn-helix transcriptional regulator [Leifsonia aquatica]|uniref:helix-turn-helix transcriptional regulator n=1 Tax=Leifsonia aquatica TaxID=144185 RepID=UPI00046AAF33|nr:helix-turn-helix domain-containing protein [Leifsonia aquatica]